MSAATAYPVLTTPQLADDATPSFRWIVDDLIATRMITLFTSRWKAGKTTFVSALLSQMNGGGLLGGMAVSPGRAAVVTEESAALWRDRHQRLQFAPDVQWCCRPFHGRPTFPEWQRLIDQFAAEPPDLLVIDPLAMVLPGDVENSAAALLGALEPLHALTDRGTAVLLVHHPRKGGPNQEMTPRGSGALSGFVDILVELERPHGSGPLDRRRRLKTTSRLGPPTTRVIELLEAGDNYRLVEDVSESDGFEHGWPVLEVLLSDACERITRESLLADWLEDAEKPSLTTLRRWLERAESEGRVERTGTGRRYDPFRYGLAGRKDLLPDLPSLYPQQRLDHAKLIREADAVAAASEKPRKKRHKGS